MSVAHASPLRRPAAGEGGHAGQRPVADSGAALLGAGPQPHQTCAARPPNALQCTSRWGSCTRTSAHGEAPPIPAAPVVLACLLHAGPACHRDSAAPRDASCRRGSCCPLGPRCSNVLLSGGGRAHLGDLGLGLQLAAGASRTAVGGSTLHAGGRRAGRAVRVVSLRCCERARTARQACHLQCWPACAPSACLPAAPELLLGQRCTLAADVYSLGLLLVQLTTGHIIRRRGDWRSPAVPDECPQVSWWGCAAAREVQAAARHGQERHASLHGWSPTPYRPSAGRGRPHSGVRAGRPCGAAECWAGARAAACRGGAQPWPLGRWLGLEPAPARVQGA